jgi:hypothetical protein
MAFAVLIEDGIENTSRFKTDPFSLGKFSRRLFSFCPLAFGFCCLLCGLGNLSLFARGFFTFSGTGIALQLGQGIRRFCDGPPLRSPT